jgi:hypothetical protein
MLFVAFAAFCEGPIGEIGYESTPLAEQRKPGALSCSPARNHTRRGRRLCRRLMIRVRIRQHRNQLAQI